MEHKQDISIGMAQEVSKKSGFPIIIIYGYDNETNLQHVTTFGESKKQCLLACKFGNWLKKQLGWRQDKCNSEPEKGTLEQKK